MPHQRRRSLLLPLALLATLLAFTTLALACTSDDPQPTATPTPSPTPEATQPPIASPTTTPVPDVRNATVLLSGLRVRTAPAGPDLGRLPEGERVIVVGRYLTPDEPRSIWLGVQYLGWIRYSPDNIELDRNVEALPLIEHPDLRLSTRLRANEPRTGIAAIDRVIEAVLRVDIDTLVSLVQTHQQPCSDVSEPAVPWTCPEGVATGTPVATFDIGTCGTDSQLVDQLPSYLASLLHRHSTGDELPPLHLNAALAFDRDAGGYWTFFSPSPNNAVAIGLLVTEDGAISSIGSGCGDPASSPLPTHLPLLNPYLPSPLLPPLTITAPPPTDTPEVDAVFAAFASRDADALVAMVELTEAQCTSDSRPGYNARCSDLGLNPGDTYQGISVGSCDLGLLPAEHIPEFFAGLVGADATRTTPFGAYLVSELWWSGRGGVVVIFADPDDEPVRQVWNLYLSNGHITSVFASCGTPLPAGSSIARWLIYPADLGYDLLQLPPIEAYDSPRLHRAFGDADLGTIGLREPLTLPWLTVHGLPLAGYRLPVGDSASVALFDLPDLETTAELRDTILGQLPEPLLPGARAIWTTDRTLIILWNRMPNWDIEDVLTHEFGEPLFLEPNQDPAGARPFDGSPFGGKDLILALRASGIDAMPHHEGIGLCRRAPDCGTGILYTYGTPDYVGDFNLWVYDTTEARAAEWDLAPDGRATQLVGSSHPGAFYGHENLVVLLSEPLDLTARLIIDTLLSLTPPDEVIVPPRPAEGSPLGGADLVEALALANLEYAPEDQGLSCTGAGALGDVYGGPSGPSFVLWIYPTSDALEHDWDLPATGPPVTKLDYCPLGSGHAYWNENLLLVFEEPRIWQGHDQLREQITAVFLTLRPREVAQPPLAAEPPWLARPGLPTPVYIEAVHPVADEGWLYVDPDDGSPFTSPLLPPDVPIELTTATASPYWLIRTSDGHPGPGVDPNLLTAVLSPNGDVWNIGPAWVGAVSPDGSHVALISQAEGATLEVIARSDGIRYNLGDFGKPASLSWSTDNVLAIAPGDALFLAHAPDWIPVAATAFEVNSNRVAWAPDGTRIAFFEDDGLYVVDRALTEKHQLVALESWTSDGGRRPSAAAINQAAQWSPDSTRIAYTTGSAIHVVDVATGAITPVTPEGVASFFLTTFAWSPDGTRIAVASEHPDHRGIVIAHADGSGAYQLTQSVAFSILGWSDIGIATYLCRCP